MDEALAIYVVDDDEDLRNSTVELLQMRTEYEVTAFADGLSWLEAEADLPPGCVLLDYSMPYMSGIAVLDEMRNRGSAHQVIMITGEGNVAVAVQAMHAGANDFIEKPVAFTMLEMAIRLAAQRLNNAIGAKRAAAQALEKIERLKPREREVMLCLAEGLPNKLIAHQLGLSVRTVEVYRANLMDKMEVRSLADVIKLVFNAGLIKI